MSSLHSFAFELTYLRHAFSSETGVFFMYMASLLVVLHRCKPLVKQGSAFASDSHREFISGVQEKQKHSISVRYSSSFCFI